MSSSEIKQDLIIDFGLHKGEDTEYYLRKGFRVAAIEADPTLARAARRRFSKEIEIGRLHIFEGAVAEGSGTTPFYQNEISVWGTIFESRAEQNRKKRSGADSTIIEVPILDIDAIFKITGIPHYLKLDIEGGEYVVLNALLEFSSVPNYISVESEKVSFNKLLSELKILKALGYNRFKAVQQASIPGLVLSTTDLAGRELIYKFELHSSGPFGKDLSGRWLTYFEVCLRYLWIFFLYRLFGDNGLLFKIRGGRRLHSILIRLTGRIFPGWYDTHAMRSG
jgi:FkbM family methyltransferase